MRRALSLSLALALSVPSLARADTAACARVLEDARRLHAAGKLNDAVRAMDECVECPALADVCARTREALRDAVPSLAVTVHDCGGHALPDATLSIDGAAVAQGEPVALDPGPHAVRAELRGRVEEQTVLVAEHETRRAALLLPGSRATLASAVAIGAGSGVALATAAGLWAWAQSVGVSPVAPAGALASNDGGFATASLRDGLYTAAAVTLSIAITGALAAIAIWAASR